MKVSLRKTRLPISLTKPARRLAIFIISLLVLLLLSRFTFMRNLAHGTQYRLVRLGTWVGDGYQNVIASEETLTGQINILQNQVAVLALETIEVAALQDTIEQQALLLDYERFDTSQQTSAHVISRDVDERQLFLDRGSDEGIREGLPVIIADGHLVAIIETVYKHTSEARLISAYEQSIAATIYGESRTRGRIEGQDGFYLHMSFVPREERINVNDVVATSGLDPLIPDQLIIGLVESVESPDQDPFKKILIKPIFDVRDFNEVLILDPLAGL